MNTATLLLSRSDVLRSIDIAQVVVIVEQTFRDHGFGRVVVPAKVTLDMSTLGLPRSVNAMPAYVESQRAYGIKWVGGFVDNPQHYGLPYIMAVLVINDPETGIPVAIMDGVEITAMRTGAAAAVAARHLHRTGLVTAAFVGCGAQARSSLEALHTAVKVAEVRCFDISEMAAQSLAARAQELGLCSVVAQEARAAVEGATLVVTATVANEPLIDRDWIAPGTLVVKLGSFQELDDALTLNADRLVVDHRQQCEHRGELPHLFRSGKMTQADIDCELGEVVAGNAPGRESQEQVIVAALIGMGSEDVAVGAAVFQQARKLGLGRSFDFLA